MKSRGFLLALLVLLFLALRLPVLFVREPFFDELFTNWIARKSLGGILEALRHDSGPPLYYFVVHALGLKSVFAARVLSLVFASLGFAALIAARQHVAAAFVAVFPPSVLFSVDARSYALCAIFITVAVMAIDRKRPWIACAALLLAAYSHYYAVLLFPLLWRHWRALAVTAIAFAPGFWLAFHQPPEALAWRHWQWPDALFTKPPLLLLVAAVALLVTVGLRRAVVPLALSLVAGVYVPMRFESVVAPVLAVDMYPRDTIAGPESGARIWSPKALLIVLLFILCTWISANAIVDYAGRAPDDYQLAAAWLVRHVPRGERVVASGYLYLPSVVAGAEVESFPAEQAIHPGWRALPRSTDAPPQAPFVWIGETAAPERKVLERSRRVEPLYVNQRAMVARIR